MRIELSTGGVRVHIFGEGENVLVLHGWGDSGESWIPFAQSMASRYRCVLMDLPGAGESDPPPSTWGLADYVSCVEELIAELGLETFVLVGHSFGGKIASALAAKRPAGLNGLILVAASGVQGKRLSILARIYLFKFLKLLLKPCGQFGRSATEYLRSVFGSRDYVHAGSMREVMVRALNENIVSRLSLINVPTIVIWGNNDTELPVSLSKRFAKRIANSREHTIWDSGHFPHVEKTGEMKHIIERFLDGLFLELRALQNAQANVQVDTTRASNGL